MEKSRSYRGLSAKYLTEAGALVAKRDGVQASEKLWGAAAEAVKAGAARRGRPLRTHGDLWQFILAVDRERPALGLRRLFAVADHLHSNFYEDELPLEAVEGFAEDIKEFVNKLESL